MDDYKAILRAFEDPLIEKRREGERRMISYIKGLLKTNQRDQLSIVYEELCDMFDKQPVGGSNYGCLYAFGAFSFGIQDDSPSSKKYLPNILMNLANGYRNWFSIDSGSKNKKVVISILMNVVGIARKLIAPCLKKLMEIVFVMLKDIDKDINKSGEAFDNILKSIIKNINENILDIDIAGCLSFMCRNIRLDKENIKTWILSWFNILLTIPQLDLTQNLPIFFKEIISMVGHQKNEVNRSVEKFLSDLRSDFKGSEYIKSRSFCIKILRSLTEIFSVDQNRKKLLEIFKWIYDILEVQFNQTNTSGDQSDKNLKEEEQKIFESIISEILLFILGCLKEEDEEVKDAALKINYLLQQKIMDVIKYQRSIQGESTNKENKLTKDNDLEVEEMEGARRKNTASFSGSNSFPQIFKYLKTMISNNSNFKTVLYAMKWIEHLLDYFPSELMQLSTSIIENIQHKNIQIVEISVVLIAKCVNKQQNYSMISQILQFIEQSLDSVEDQSKILSILKILFAYIEGEKIMKYFAESLCTSKNKKFKIQMVQCLDMIVNIESDLEDLRVKLRSQGENLFDELFKAWAVEPISAISLCLMSQKFKLCNKIVQMLSVGQMDMQMLVHLSKIVRLIDMPHYAYLRMQLLHPNRFPNLINALKGILMLLPQGKAFDALKNRLECSSLLMGLGQQDFEQGFDQREPDENIEKYVEVFLAENRKLFSKSYTQFLEKIV